MLSTVRSVNMHKRKQTLILSILWIISFLYGGIITMECLYVAFSLVAHYLFYLGTSSHTSWRCYTYWYWRWFLYQKVFPLFMVFLSAIYCDLASMYFMHLINWSRICGMSWWFSAVFLTPFHLLFINFSFFHAIFVCLGGEVKVDNQRFCRCWGFC